MKKILLGTLILLLISILLISGDDVKANDKISIYLPIVECDTCTTIFFDDFSDSESGWNSLSEEGARYDYFDGEYRIRVVNINYPAVASSGFQSPNFVASVDVRRATNNRYGSYGIAFGLAEDKSHFYAFEIDPNGNFGVYLYSISNVSSDVTTLTEGSSHHINKSNGPNHLEVKRENAAIEVSANGHNLATLIDNTITGIYYLGLIAYKPAPIFIEDTLLDIRFDNFHVKRITQPSGNCDPAYYTVCIPPPPPDLECSDIIYRNFPVLPADPHNFDVDNDGIGCES